MEQVRFFIVPINSKVGGVEHFSKFVAHETHDGLEIHFSGQILLEGVDDLQFIDAFLQLMGALVDLLFKANDEACIIYCDGCLICKHADHIAVGFVENTVGRIHIHVDVADEFVLGDEWGNDSAESLLFGENQLSGMGEAGSGEISADRSGECPRVFSVWE